LWAGEELRPSLNKTSNDFPIGMCYNMVQCWLLLRLMAQITGKNPRFTYHRSVNSHIYGPQLAQVPLQLERSPLAEPTIDINPDIKSLADVVNWVTPADFIITVPETHPPIKYPFAV
jgi:thymidylate synthase